MTKQVDDLTLEERQIIVRAAEQALGGIFAAVPEHLQQDTVSQIFGGYAVAVGLSAEDAQELARLGYGIAMFIKERTEAAVADQADRSRLAGAAEAEV